MTQFPAKPVRRVRPRKLALLTATSLAAAAPLALPVLTAGATVYAASAEAGEAGEAGIVLGDGPSVFLTELGYFEGTYLIIAQLYLSGARDAARAHMEESHHAIYEEIAPKLAELNAPGFDEAAASFAQAVTQDAADEQVAAARDAVLAAVAASGAAANLSLRDQILAIKDLLVLAHAEYEGGVTEGSVEVPIEYRDSWGFYETARRRTAALAVDPDPAAAKAGHSLLAKLDGLDALYSGLTARNAATDPSALAAAGGWAEIIALQQD